jgi:hypothetical protein
MDVGHSKLAGEKEWKIKVSFTGALRKLRARDERKL